MLCVWILFRSVLAVCRACSSGVLARRRAATGKTPLSTLRYRYYWYLFVVLSPMLYPFSFDTTGSRLFSIWHWLVPIISFFIATSIWLTELCFLMRPAGRLVNSGASEPDYEAWLEAGGHPFWDGNSWCNFDRAVVRAAIGRPPESDHCCACGARITGLFRMGGNFGNRCNECGTYNDTFEAGPA
jgi:hypothetical protein